MNARIPSRGRDPDCERIGELGFAADYSGTRQSAATPERARKQQEATQGRFVCILVAALSLGVNSSLLGQAFNSGSNGSYGPLNVTTDTVLDMPADGIFNCTSITVNSQVTLTFKKNPLNTPVYLLATGDVSIYGTIDVSGAGTSGAGGGKGGPGGFDGGYSAVAPLAAGEGHGPGGGKANEYGVFAVSSGSNTNIYGNSLLIPLIGGSGGGPWTSSSYGGGGGGGAVLLASSTRVNLVGAILARGNSGINYAGSGGGIRIVAPLVEGSGTLDASGSGSLGRVRIDSTDRYAYANLTIKGKFARGSNMFVSAPGNPRLDIVSAAGTAIPEGTNAFVSITLSAGSSTNQAVRVQARGFTNDIPIRVRVTPDFGQSGTFDSVILLSSGNPPHADVNVTLVPEVLNRIYAWTR
jgi:hypothetical protein